MITKLRYLFFAVGIVALGYAGWSYLDSAWLQEDATRAFDESRELAPKQPPSEYLPIRSFPAKLRIPSIGLEAMVEEGSDQRVLRYAAGHITNTGVPGQIGNVGIAAHRDSFFRGLRFVKPGDRILLSTIARDYEYVVDGTTIVDPKNVGVLQPVAGRRTLTLVTCYPFYYVGHAPQRFIVRAHQVSPVQGSSRTAKKNPPQPRMRSSAAIRRVSPNRAY